MLETSPPGGSFQAVIGFYKPAGQLVINGGCRVPRPVAEPRCVARHCAV